MSIQATSSSPLVRYDKTETEIQSPEPKENISGYSFFKNFFVYYGFVHFDDYTLVDNEIIQIPEITAEEKENIQSKLNEKWESYKIESKVDVFDLISSLGSILNINVRVVGGEARSSLVDYIISTAKYFLEQKQRILPKEQEEDIRACLKSNVADLDLRILFDKNKREALENYLKGFCLNNNLQLRSINNGHTLWYKIRIEHPLFPLDLAFYGELERTCLSTQDALSIELNEKLQILSIGVDRLDSSGGRQTMIHLLSGKVSIPKVNDVNAKGWIRILGILARGVELTDNSQLNDLFTTFTKDVKTKEFYTQEEIENMVASEVEDFNIKHGQNRFDKLVRLILTCQHFLYSFQQRLKIDWLTLLNKEKIVKDLILLDEIENSYFYGLIGSFTTDEEIDYTFLIKNVMSLFRQDEAIITALYQYFNTLTKQNFLKKEVNFYLEWLNKLSLDKIISDSEYIIYIVEIFKNKIKVTKKNTPLLFWHINKISEISKTNYSDDLNKVRGRIAEILKDLYSNKTLKLNNILYNLTNKMLLNLQDKLFPELWLLALEQFSDVYFSIFLKICPLLKECEGLKIALQEFLASEKYQKIYVEYCKKSLLNNEQGYITYLKEELPLDDIETIESGLEDLKKHLNNFSLLTADQIQNNFQDKAPFIKLLNKLYEKEGDILLLNQILFRLIEKKVLDLSHTASQSLLKKAAIYFSLADFIHCEIYFAEVAKIIKLEFDQFVNDEKNKNCIDDFLVSSFKQGIEIFKINLENCLKVLPNKENKDFTNALTTLSTEVKDEKLWKDLFAILLNETTLNSLIQQEKKGLIELFLKITLDSDEKDFIYSFLPQLLKIANQIDLNANRLASLYTFIKESIESKEAVIASNKMQVTVFIKRLFTDKIDWKELCNLMMRLTADFYDQESVELYDLWNRALYVADSNVQLGSSTEITKFINYLQVSTIQFSCKIVLVLFKFSLKHASKLGTQLLRIVCKKTWPDKYNEALSTLLNQYLQKYVNEKSNDAKKAVHLLETLQALDPKFHDLLLNPDVINVIITYSEVVQWILKDSSFKEIVKTTIARTYFLKLNKDTLSLSEKKELALGAYYFADDEARIKFVKTFIDSLKMHARNVFLTSFKAIVPNHPFIMATKEIIVQPTIIVEDKIVTPIVKDVLEELQEIIQQNSIEGFKNFVSNLKKMIVKNKIKDSSYTTKLIAVFIETLTHFFPNKLNDEYYVATLIYFIDALNNQKIADKHQPFAFTIDELTKTTPYANFLSGKSLCPQSYPWGILKDGSHILLKWDNEHQNIELENQLQSNNIYENIYGSLSNRSIISAIIHLLLANAEDEFYYYEAKMNFILPHLNYWLSSLNSRSQLSITDEEVIEKLVFDPFCKHDLSHKKQLFYGSLVMNLYMKHVRRSNAQLIYKVMSHFGFNYNSDLTIQSKKDCINDLIGIYLKDNTPYMLLKLATIILSTHHTFNYQGSSLPENIKNLFKIKMPIIIERYLAFENETILALAFDATETSLTKQVDVKENLKKALMQCCYYTGFFSEKFFEALSLNDMQEHVKEAILSHYSADIELVKRILEKYMDVILASSTTVLDPVYATELKETLTVFDAYNDPINTHDLFDLFGIEYDDRNQIEYYKKNRSEIDKILQEWQRKVTKYVINKYGALNFWSFSYVILYFRSTTVQRIIKDDSAKVFE